MECFHLTEDEMADVKKEAIDRLRPYLVEKIIAERHFDFLRSRKILSRDDAEEISGRGTRSRRTSKLLDILAENPRGLDVLLESIKWSRTLDFIIARITDEVQRVKSERLEALKAAASAPAASEDLPSVGGAYDRCSTLCYHPEGESSRSSSALSVCSLPRPGEPGAPALPEEPDAEGGACGSGADGHFQPLRSRSLSVSAVEGAEL